MFIKTFFLVLLIALFPLSLLSKTTADCLGAVNWQTKAVRFYVMCNKNDLLMDKDKCAKAMITIKSALKNNDYSYTDHEDDFEDLYSTQKYTGEFAIIVKSSQGQEGIKILVYDPSTNSGGSFVPIADGTDINAILLSFKNEMKKIVSEILFYLTCMV